MSGLNDDNLVVFMESLATLKKGLTDFVWATFVLMLIHSKC